LYGGPYPFIQTGDIRESGGRITKHSQTYSEEGLRQSRLWPAGTLCITIAANIAETAVLTYPACFPDSVVGFIANDCVCDVRFVEYVFRQLRKRLQWEASGSVQDNINLETLNRLTLALPPLSVQKEIVSILGAIDDKIDLNRRMNETLEAIARAIFKAWFVDFDPVREGHPLFPRTFVESVNGGRAVPHGWKLEALPQALEVNPHRRLSAEEKAPYLDMANLPTSAARAIDWAEREFGSGMRFKNGDVLVARITPCLENGKTAYVDFLEEGQVGWGSTEYIVLRSKPPLPTEYAYFLARSEGFRAHAITNMTGTTGRQRVPVSCFNSFKVVVPSPAVAEEFGKFAETTMAGLKRNDEESRTLASLRDTLLPKLLSGEIRMKQAEKMVGKAV
jgi:type I restriction enzyme S subunit